MDLQYFLFFSLDWLLNEDKEAIDIALRDIEDYLQTKEKMELKDERSCFEFDRNKFDRFNLKMIGIGSAAMAFSMLSGKVSIKNNVTKKFTFLAHSPGLSHFMPYSLLVVYFN